MTVTGFFHVGVTVESVDRSLPFYRDGLGLAVALDTVVDGPYLRDVLGLSLTAIRAVYLDIPGGGIVELLQYEGLERMSAASRPCDYGGGHLCLYVDDVDATLARGLATGGGHRGVGAVDITRGPNVGARSAYLLDPDGFPVEVFQRP